MVASVRQTQRAAERRFPVRVRIAVPQGGFGRQLAVMHAWLDEVCGKAGWTSAPAGRAGIVNDAVAFYFDDAVFAQAFVNRFCCGYRPVAIDRGVEGAFALRSGTTALRREAAACETGLRCSASDLPSPQAGKRE